VRPLWRRGRSQRSAVSSANHVMACKMFKIKCTKASHLEKCNALESTCLKKFLIAFCYKGLLVTQHCVLTRCAASCCDIPRVTDCLTRWKGSTRERWGGTLWLIVAWPTSRRSASEFCTTCTHLARIPLVLVCPADKDQRGSAAPLRH
jgi:hypothetical protein